MRDFFRSWKFKIFIVIAALLLGLMLRAYATGGSTLVQTTVGVIISPFQKLSSQISGWAGGLIGDVQNFSSLKAQNEQLKKQVSDLQSKIVDYNDLKRENQQLEGLVDLSREDNSYKYTGAMVISRDPGQFFSAFTIDKGSASGIQKDEPVITSQGIVGVVTNVMATSSVVTSIMDPSMHVGAIVSQTGDVGVTQGQRELASSGKFMLSYIAKNSSITAGNIVITSGIGGIYPKNLKIGVVEQVKPDVSGNTVNAICKPLVDPATVKDVTVITSFNGKQTEGGGK